MCSVKLHNAYCIVVSNRIYDQPEDGLEKGRNMYLFLRYAMGIKTS